MGSSWRSDLNSGFMKDIESVLRDGIAKIKQVLEWSYNWEDDGQFDNSSDDGAFRERLRICIALLEEELPK